MSPDPRATPDPICAHRTCRKPLSHHTKYRCPNLSFVQQFKGFETLARGHTLGDLQAVRTAGKRRVR